MVTPFKTEQTVELYQVDGANILFYAQIFLMAHQALASFLRKNGYSIKDRLEKRDFVFPVVHAEADYKKPLMLDDVVTIDLVISQINTSSFEVHFSFYKEGALAATAQVIHATIDAQTHSTQILPPDFKIFLESYSLKASSL